MPGMTPITVIKRDVKGEEALRYTYGHDPAPQTRTGNPGGAFQPFRSAVYGDDPQVRGSLPRDLIFRLLVQHLRDP